MELLCVFAALAAVFLFSAFLTLKCGLHSALAPLTALAVAVLWLTVWGMAGPLLAGAWLLYAAFAGLGLWALWPRKDPAKRPDYRALLTPGAVLFYGMTAAFAVYFFIRQPMATGFDELNLWATAVKVTKVDDSLYATATLGTPWAVTQNPGLPLLSYFFSFFGSYADWKIYLAYNALAFAVFAAVLGTLGFSRFRIAVPLAAVLWCVPYFFTTYNHTIYLNTVYMTSYGDIPAGLVMGGAVALWLALRRSNGPKWVVLPVLALAANLKANTFVLALVAAGLVAVDAWLLPDGKFRRGLARRTGFAAACFAAPLAVYYLWNVRYVGYLVAQNTSDGGVGETTAALSDVVVSGIRILLGQPVEGFFAERQSQFLQAIADMGAQFWTSAGALSMIGQGRNVVILILAVFLLAACLAPCLKARLRVACAAVCSTLCFLGYNLMLALSYGFIFKPFQAESLTDYNRYIYSYYIGWFLIALACLVLQPYTEVVQIRLKDGPAAAFKCSASRFALAGQGAVLLLAAAMLFRLNQLVLPQLSVLGFSDSEFADRKAERAEARLVCSYLGPDDRVFYVSQGDNGEGWFSAVFDFYPVLVDYSGAVSTMEGGGGTFGLAELEPEEEGVKKYYYHPYTARRLDETIRENGCTVLYLQQIDEIFVESYAELFTDGLAAAQNGETLLYRVTDAGFAPVEMEVTGR